MIDIFYIYAALSRLAIIGAGFGCIVMGYRLFILGVMPQNGSDIDVQYREVRLTAKNAAPGTIFAFVGLAMILAMLIQGVPERKTVHEKSTQRIGETGQTGTMRGNPDERMDVEKTTVTERGGNEDIFTIIKRNKKFEQNDKLNNAIKDAAGSLRAIAATYLEQGLYDEAIAFASFANQADRENAEGLALIARIEFQRGKYKEADKAISMAAEKDPSFTSERDELKERTKSQKL